jgi:hypothetical protein
MSYLSDSPTKATALVLFCILIVVGCSSSGNPTDQAEVNTTNHVNEVPNADLPSQNTTRVDFEITVPAYQSDALQLRVQWGEQDILAAWVGDEQWIASGDFPTSTEGSLVVTFSDNNGAIPLGSFESIYSTGTNASELYQISADQFNTGRWDTDEDGTTNIDELIADTNPLLDEAQQLEVRESYVVTSLIPVSSYYEASISNARPYSFLIEDLPPVDASFYTDRRTHVVTIEIDDMGNGIFSDNYRFAGAADRDITIENQEGTRTNTGSSILWTGTYNRSNTGAGVSDDIEFSNETWSIDNTARKQNGSVIRQNNGNSSGSYEQELTYSLVGDRLEDSTNCQAITGTITDEITYTAFANGRPNAITSITKDSDDTYWTVEVASLEGDLLDKYLVISITPNFYCDMVDL